MIKNNIWRFRKIRISFALVLVLSMGSMGFAQQWSSWSVVSGVKDIAYRGQSGTCLASGCLKSVEFRNNSKRSIQFTYTIWSEDMQDKSKEVKDTGITSILAGATVSVKGAALKRVVIEEKSAATGTSTAAQATLELEATLRDASLEHSFDQTISAIRSAVAKGADLNAAKVGGSTALAYALDLVKSQSDNANQFRNEPNLAKIFADGAAGWQRIADVLRALGAR
jgi:hypothetical protein